MLQAFNTLEELTRAFPDEDTCIRHLRAIRWAEGAFCPYCGSNRVYNFKDGHTHKCGDCRQRFSIKVGSIFEDTKLPLRKWFMAIWLVTSHKRGIASTQLAKDIGITQKSAWFVLHRLRHAARTRSFNRPLEGEIEADETYVGGKEKNKHASKRTQGATGRSLKTKAAVFGMLERGGELRAMRVSNVGPKTLQGEIVKNVKAGSNVMTDQHLGYTGLQGRYHHHTVNHGLGEYVKHYFIHVNGLENAWSHFKRQVTGTHFWVSGKHLDRYLSEFTWRYNRRSNSEGGRVNALLAQVDGRLKYADLIA